MHFFERFRIGSLLVSFFIVMVWSSCVWAFPNTPDQNLWMPNSSVSAVAATPDGKTYLGGAFTYWGPYTGSLARISPDNGRMIAGDFSAVSGKINTIVSDGSGGVYIGGDFDKVGNTSRSRLAHLRADGSLDTHFNPPDLNHEVRALLRIGNRLYVGGSFTRVGSQTINYLVVLNPDTGLVILGIVPSLIGSSGSVNAFQKVESRIYIGGHFSIPSVDGIIAQNLAAINFDDGSLIVGGAAPVPGSQVVYCFQDVPSLGLYVGGMLTSVDDGPAGGLVILNRSTGARSDAVVPPFFAIATPEETRSGMVMSLAVAGDRLYVGGLFTSVNGDNNYSSIAALSLADGNLLPSWCPTLFPSFPSLVSSMLVSGGRLYVGGQFIKFDSEKVSHLAVLNVSDGSVIHDGSIRVSDPVLAMAQSGTTLYVGGQFFSAGGIRAVGLAVMDGSSRFLPTNTPDFVYSSPSFPLPSPSMVTSLAVRGNRLYVGGLFNRVDDETVGSLAVLDTNTGNRIRDPLFPSFSHTSSPYAGIKALKFVGNRLYVGGGFDRVGTEAVSGLAVLDADTGRFLPGMPLLSHSGRGVVVNALEVYGNRLYLGGNFDGVGGISATDLSALDLSGDTVRVVDNIPGTRMVTGIGSDGSVSTLAIVGDRLYVGGDFNQMGTQSVIGLAAINLPDHSIVSGIPRLAAPEDGAASIFSLFASGRRLYVGGRFNSINSVPAANFAVLKSGDGSHVAGMNPGFDNIVSYIAKTGNSLYVGGIFTRVGDRERHGLACFTQPVVGFRSPAGSGTERGESLSIAVDLSTTTTEAVSASYIVSGTATSGEDYSIASGPLTIPAGSTTANLVLNLRDDGRHEANPETIIVTLGDSPEFAGLNVSQRTFTYTLNDNDPSSETGTGSGATTGAGGPDAGGSAGAPGDSQGIAGTGGVGGDGTAGTGGVGGDGSGGGTVADSTSTTTDVPASPSGGGCGCRLQDEGATPMSPIVTFLILSPLLSLMGLKRRRRHFHDS